jgi:hypothetical protein
LDLIEAAMDEATYYYNCYTDITKSLSIDYDPGVPTAEGNVDGHISFGSRASMNYITAMHEISHTVGVAYYSWNTMIVGGIWQGEIATSTLRALDGDPTAEVHGDTQHFWPHGLNYTTEVPTDNPEPELIAHCTMVVALRQDMGVTN